MVLLLVECLLRVPRLQGWRPSKAAKRLLRLSWLCLADGVWVLVQKELPLCRCKGDAYKKGGGSALMNAPSLGPLCARWDCLTITGGRGGKQSSSRVGI
eukprot:1159943-Pelagomonas_calceolata.AAC.3